MARPLKHITHFSRGDNRLIKYSLVRWLLIYSITFCTPVFGQYLREPIISLYTVFDDDHKINAWHVGNNPAFLFQDATDELLCIRSAIDNASGDFRRFIDPGRTTLFQQSAAGKKTIDSVQVFKGHFGIQNLRHHNWTWLATKNYASGSPFLFGDSTAGQTNYNGIIMNAAYARKIGHKFLVGIEVNYHVDEGLKTVSPKPTSKHRDIDMRLGAGYVTESNLAFGFHSRVYNNFESIAYREDEGAIMRETVLFKFRGYDFPETLNKKVETRYSWHRGYFNYGTVSYKIHNRFAAAASFGGGIEDIRIEDDALNPIENGYWRNDVYETRMKASYHVMKNLSAGIDFRYRHDDMWARHPSFNVLLMEREIKQLLTIGGLKYRLSSVWSLGMEGGVHISRQNNNDYYSNIPWSFDGQKVVSNVGCRYAFSSSFQIVAGYGYNQYSSRNIKFVASEGSKIFSDFRNQDIFFYQTGYSEHVVNAKASIMFQRLGMFHLYIHYAHRSATDTDIFNDCNYDNLSVILEYRVKVY
jgi:hypothetical protein